MAMTLTLTGKTSELTAHYFPPKELNGDYECCLVDFTAFNSIPNVDVGNNLFHIGEVAPKSIEIPVGSYELEDIVEYIREEYEDKNGEKYITIEPNNNTMQVSVFSSHDAIHFEKKNSIGQLFGFTSKVLESGVEHLSDRTVNISNVNILRIECNIVTNTYINNSSSHTLHQFAIDVPPGYKIDERPRNLIYLPVNCKEISSITARIVSESGSLVNFRGEEITLRLHLKPLV